MKKKVEIQVDSNKCAQCLLCELMCSFALTRSFNLAQSRIRVDIQTRVIDFSKDCDKCGICAHYCAYGALTIRRSRVAA
jgi:ferredoxin